MSAPTSTTKAISPTGTASYPHVATPQAPMNGQAGNPKYSLTVIFDEKAVASPEFAAMKAAVVAAAEAAYPGKGTNMLQTGALKSPFRRDCEAKSYKNCAVFINVRTEKKPGVVGAQADPLTGKAKIIADDKIESEIYPGAQVKVSVNAFAYNQSGNKGVSLALNNVQKVGDGERIDGRAAAQDEFAASDLSTAPVADLPF